MPRTESCLSPKTFQDIIAMPLKLKRKKRLAGERAGLKKARIILTASRQFETTESLKILTLAKALGVVPTTIKSHFRGGAPQICTEIARMALAGAARPYKPRDTQKEYLTELFSRVLQKLSGKPMVARLVAIELSWNPLLDPPLAERILVFIDALGFPAGYLPRGLSRVIGRLSDMIFTECAQSNEARQETVARRIASSIDRLDPDEFPMLAENKEALLRHARLSAVGPPRREIAAEYAVATLELLKAEIKRAPSQLNQDDEHKEAEPMETPTDLGEI
jgi:AcrR family transcriptional regulator